MSTEKEMYDNLCLHFRFFMQHQSKLTLQVHFARGLSEVPSHSFTLSSSVCGLDGQLGLSFHQCVFFLKPRTFSDVIMVNLHKSKMNLDPMQALVYRSYSDFTNYLKRVLHGQNNVLEQNSVAIVLPSPLTQISPLVFPVFFFREAVDASGGARPVLQQAPPWGLIGALLVKSSCCAQFGRSIPGATLYRVWWVGQGHCILPLKMLTLVTQLSFCCCSV